MARPTRKKIKFTEESLNELAQEIYNESHNIKSKLGRLYSKWEIKVKEGGEIAAIGDQIIKLINAESKNQDQKLTLLKYLKDIIYSSEKLNQQSDGADNSVYSAELRNQIIDTIEDHIKNKEEY